MKSIAIGIITAPREIPTLKACVNSYKKHINWPLHIFAEPGEVNFTGSDIVLIQHPTRLGAFRNYDAALRWFLVHSKAEVFCILEDDYIFASNLKGKLIEILNRAEPYGYFNLFTNGYHPTIHEKMINEGWNLVDYGFENSWGVAYVMERTTVMRLISHEFYLKILSERNRVIDGTVSECMKQMGLPMYYHNPSLIYSIGFSSTLGNEYKTDGYKFKGK